MDTIKNTKMLLLNDSQLVAIIDSSDVKYFSYLFSQQEQLGISALISYCNTVVLS